MTLLLPPDIKGLKCNLWRLAYLYLYFSSMANTFYLNTYLVFTPVYTFDQEKCSRVQNTFGWWNQINCRPYKWTESHKIWKVWALVNHALPLCFRSFGLWFHKSYHRVKQVDMSESTNINQSISINLFYPIEAPIFIQYLFCFPIIHHNLIFSAHVRSACYSNKWKAWHLCCSILKLLMVI